MRVPPSVSTREKRRKEREQAMQAAGMARKVEAFAPVVGTVGGGLIGGTLGAVGGGMAGSAAGGVGAIPGAITGGLAGAGAGSALGGAAGGGVATLAGGYADDIEAKDEEEELRKAQKLEQAMMLIGPYMNRG